MKSENEKGFEWFGFARFKGGSLKRPAAVFSRARFISNLSPLHH